MSNRTLQEFEVPFFGKVEVIQGHEDGIDGRYFLRAEVYGIAGRFSKSAEEARDKGLTELYQYSAEQHKELSEKLDLIDAGRKQLSSKLKEPLPKQVHN